MFTPERILIAVDLTRNANALVRAFNALDVEKRCEVVLLHVIPDFIELGTPYMKKKLLAENQKTMEASAVAMLKDFAKKKLSRASYVECVVAKGSPADGILLAARERKANLIVLGIPASGQTDAKRTGSIALKVLEKTPCPVLFAPLSKV